MSLSVSVVIPTYNRAADVLRAIGSVLAQTHQPLEILVVDDGSTDDTAARVKALPAPVAYLHQPNGGVSSARNLGFREARGDCIALLDSDDSWAPRWLELAVQALQADPSSGSVCADTRSVDVHGKPLGVSNFSSIAQDGRVPLPALFVERIGLGSNLCVRRPVLDAAGHFDETLATGEDVDLALRLAAIAGVRLVAQPLITLTKAHQSSLSGRINTGNRLRVFDKFEALHPRLAAQHASQLRAARADTAYSYALDLTVARQLADARARVLESWRYAPSLRAAKQLAKINVLQLLGRAR